MNQDILIILESYPEVQKLVCMMYSIKVPEKLFGLGYTYEETRYLFSENPGYSSLLEYLNSPILSARSFSVKHFLRAALKTKIFYLEKIISLAQPDKPLVEYHKNYLEDDIWELLCKLAISSPLCLAVLIQKIEISIIYLKNPESFIGVKLIQYAKNYMKKTKYIWERYIEQMSFLNNLWLIINEDNIVKGIIKLFNDGECLYSNLHLTIFPLFKIHRISLEVKFIKKHPTFTVINSEGASKSLIFVRNTSYTRALCYNFIIKLFLSQMKAKGLPIRLKLRKIECMIVRNKEEIGSIIEFTDMQPYEYKDIIVSHALYLLILFLLGIQDDSKYLSVSPKNKIIIDPTKLDKIKKHHTFFKVNRGCDLPSFRYWIITAYMACREIFENMLWIMQGEFWNCHKLRFYYSLPIKLAIEKIQKRITKDNS